MLVVWQTGLSNINTSSADISMSQFSLMNITQHKNSINTHMTENTIIKCSISLQDGPKSSGHLFEQGLADNHSKAVNLLYWLEHFISHVFTGESKRRGYVELGRGKSSFVISSIPHLCYHLITLTLLSPHNPHLCHHLINLTSVITS